MRADPVELIVKKIAQCRRLAITSHLRPDGDSLCTSIALARMAEALGKEAEIINKDRTPFPYDHHPDIQKIRIGQILPRKFDVIILLECADVSRSGQTHLNDYYKINIDHHYSNYYYADINWVDPTASAVGEMALELGERLQVPFSSQIAENLYCAIVSDTGSFQFSNTTARSFEACSKLIRYGADSFKVSDFLFNNNSPEKIRLLGQVLSTLRMNRKGNIATIAMFRDKLAPFQHNEVDTEDITTLARSIKGVEVVLFFKEMKKNTFRVSIRSKGRANAALIAEHFQGGGHVHASGFTATGAYEKLLKEIPETIEKLLKKRAKTEAKLPSKYENPAS
jgi:phosphoesterase RecJ-like protein